MFSQVTVYAGDIQIGVQNSTIQYGAQIVDFIRIRLTGVADNFGRDPQPVRCSPCMPYDGDAATCICLILRLLYISWPCFERPQCQRTGCVLRIQHDSLLLNIRFFLRLMAPSAGCLRDYPDLMLIVHLPLPRDSFA